MSQNPNTVKAPVQQTQQHLQSWTRGHTEEKHKQNRHGFMTQPPSLASHPQQQPVGCGPSIKEEQTLKAWKVL